MYDPKTDATTVEERYARENETLFEHVYRVVEGWKHHPRSDPLTFKKLPAELKRDYPDVFGPLEDEKLGVIVSLVWMYLGGKGTINEAIIRKWFRDAVMSA